MMLFFILTILLLQAGTTLSRPICWNTKMKLRKALKIARAGDTVCLADGIYNNLVIQLAKDYVSLQGQSGGNVILKGSSSVVINGVGINVSNLKFTAPSGSSRFRGRPSPIQFGFKAESCKVFDCMIDNHTAHNWVRVRGRNNAIYKCTFKSKPPPELDASGREVSQSKIIYASDNNLENITIRHNKFLNYDPDAAVAKHRHNGAEAVFVKIYRAGGRRETKLLNCKIHNNYFYKIDGEEETIGIKSSGNIIYKNAIEFCYGGISLRHGRSNTVRDNYIRARKKKSRRNYGINAHDANHVIENNWVMDVGQFHGIKVVGGNGPLDCNSCHVRAKNVSISNNTLINSVLWLGKEFPTGTYSEPENIRIDTITPSLFNNKSYPMINGHDLSTPAKFTGSPYSFTGSNRFYGPNLADTITFNNLKPLLTSSIPGSSPNISWVKKYQDLGAYGTDMIKKIKCEAGASWEVRDTSCSLSG